MFHDLCVLHSVALKKLMCKEHFKEARLLRRVRPYFAFRVPRYSAGKGLYLASPQMRRYSTKV
jgi:hypothetical protein